MGMKQSRMLEKPKHESKNLLELGKRSRAENDIAALHRAALKGDWAAAEQLLLKNKSLITTPITEGGEIALHVAAVEGHEAFVAKLLDIMDVADVEIMNLKGCTALTFAAADGHTNIARKMVEKNPNLPTIKGENAVGPLYMAALHGFGETAEFLYSRSHFESWTDLQEKANVLTSSIESELYGLAVRIVRKNEMLAVAEDGDGVTPLEVLAEKPLAFSCNASQGLYVTRIISSALAFMKSKTGGDMNAEHDAYTLLDCLWDAAESCREDIEAAQAIDTSKLYFIAAESGNDDFLVELLRRDLNLLYKYNESRHSIFHIAVKHRYVKVFNLMYELGGTKNLLASYTDTEGNNMLHLAGKLSPPNQLNSIPGAALQMQREVLWYKEVEKLVQPSYRNKKNKADQTPHDVFTTEHESLMKEGEKFMKQTAKACMLVTMLIATVVFTTAFTVPGGYNNAGTPILENKRMFMIFPVSEAVATLSSLTSMLMFLSILTSRYSEDDFLKTLPFWLVVGVAGLFFSIVAMMVAFCTCLLFFEHGLAAVTLLLVLFSSVPIMFVILKFPLLMTILRCTYNCKWLFRSYDRLHS